MQPTDRIPLKLSKPIDAHGQPVTELGFREPTAGDIAACGHPLIIGGDGETFQFDGEATVKLIARLADIPPSAAQKMSLRDYQAAAMLITGFFGDGDQA